MTASTLTSTRLTSPAPSQQRFRLTGFHLEVVGAVALLVIANFTLLSGSYNDALLFLPSRVVEGEWWRILMHPWVHVSWYHLLLDASAFFLLFYELRALTSAKRLNVVFGSALGSVLAALFLDPHTAERGLCGLSGIAHGLMAVAALELMRSGRGIAFRLGAISFLLLISKCAVEAATGMVVFDFLHAGRIGSPVAVSHAGGVVGALVACLCRLCQRWTQ